MQSLPVILSPNNQKFAKKPHKDSLDDMQLNEQNPNASAAKPTLPLRNLTELKHGVCTPLKEYSESTFNSDFNSDLSEISMSESGTRDRHVHVCKHPKLSNVAETDDDEDEWTESHEQSL